MAVQLPEPSSEPSRRQTATYSSLPELSKPFLLDPASRSYKHQYSNIYFVRLVELRPIVEERAQERWRSVRGQSLRCFCRYAADGPARETTASPKNTESATVTIMLHCGDCLSGDAPETECPGRYGS
jgi:DNA polymerase II small subunit/DNA polymerase delta subunit B